MWMNHMKSDARFARSFSIFINTIVRQYFIHTATLLPKYSESERARRTSISKYYYLKMCLFIRCNTSLYAVADSSNAAHCIICERDCFAFRITCNRLWTIFLLLCWKRLVICGIRRCVLQIIFHHSAYPTPSHPLPFFRMLNSHIHVFKIAEHAPLL